MTAIEYCYQYSNNAETGQPLFNWTVLILEDATSNFRISSVYVIPRVVKAVVPPVQVVQVAETRLPAVMQLVNMHDASLLGFHNAVQQHVVNTILLNKAGLTLSVGSAVPRVSAVIRGFRML